MPSRPCALSDIDCLRPTRLLKSDVFRFAALFAFLFLVFTGILLVTVLWIVQGTQRAALMSANDADIATVANGFLDEGVPEAVEVVKQRLGTASSFSRSLRPDSYMAIEDEQGRQLAGNLPQLPRTLGVFTTRVAASVILGRGVEVTTGVYLFVGRDTAQLIDTRERILRAFFWVVPGAIGIAVIGGLLLGVRFMRRIDAVAATCKGIIAGRLDERIPLMGREDEWDRLAGAINEMLNRISALLENLRQVSSDVAHDLRTPLTRMRNRLEEARSKSTRISEYSAAVDTAIDDTDQLLAMFSALLRISQVEAGTRLSTFSRVPLRGVLENIFQMYLPVAEDYRHSLTLNCQKDIGIRGDAELLTQMFSNLIENAIRHTREGTQIQILLKSDGNLATASIIDNGPGIDPSEHEKVLRRFYRVSGSRSAAGHGLGLALVAAIAQLHQAKLTLSNADPGLRVDITFPIERLE